MNELWHTETPLIAASSAGHVAVTEFLLSKGADPQRKDRFGRTALSSAMRAGHKEVATILLRTASRHAKNEALYAACEVSNPALVQLLISHGADVNAEVGAEGMRPLHAAVSGQNAEVVKLLVDNGCDVNAKLKGLSQGTTPLHRAARRDGVPPEIIRILLQAGADVNARDFAMRTPLHFAAGKEGNTEIVRLLVQHGSDVRACDDRGRTPLTYALTNGEAETAEILRKAAESTR